MNGLVCIGLAALAIWVFIKAVGGGSYSNVIKTGQPARGILLTVNSRSSPVQRGAAPLESRDVTIDVEVQGQAPFVISTRAIAPTGMRSSILPGATVEIRFDPKNTKTIAIVGPGSGFAIFGPVARGSS